MGALSITWDWLASLGSGAASTQAEEFSADPPVFEVRVHVCGDPAEAAYLDMVLEQEAIAYRREETAMGPFGFAFVPQYGFCTLVVQDNDANRAVAVISQALRQQNRRVQ